MTESDQIDAINRQAAQGRNGPKIQTDLTGTAEKSRELPELPREAIDHPRHYNSHPSGIECIEITRHMNFNLGNAIKYVWRAGLKSESLISDLRKAQWYLADEITRLEKEVQP